MICIECIAIREAIKYWQYWVTGRRFTVFSNHKPLENLRIKARTDKELGHLLHNLLQYDFEIIYKLGPSNIEADYLSRNPVLEPEENQLQGNIRVVNIVTLNKLNRDQFDIDF